MYITLVLVSVIGLLAVKNKSYAAETTDTDKFLFIGNSLTYYNNLPEQFKNFAFYGAGKTSGTVRVHMVDVLSKNMQKLSALW